MTSRCQGVGPNQSITLGPELLDIPKLQCLTERATQNDGER